MTYLAIQIYYQYGKNERMYTILLNEWGRRASWTTKFTQLQPIYIQKQI